MIKRLFRFSPLALSLVFSFFMLPANGFAQQDHDSTNLMKTLVGDESIKLPAAYSFQESVTMQFDVIDLKTNEKESIEYVLYAKPGSPYIGLIPKTVNGKSPDFQFKMVVNYAENIMVSFLASAKSKMAVVQSMPEEDFLDEDYPKIEIEETGETKEIAGYTCDGFKLESPEIESTIWVTEEIDSKFDRVYKAMGVDIGADAKVADELRNGFIMSFSSVNQLDNTRSEMEVTAVNLNDDYSIETQGYTITNMPTVTAEQKAGN
jgi:GLPGLI family protein